MATHKARTKGTRERENLLRKLSCYPALPNVPVLCRLVTISRMPVRMPCRREISVQVAGPKPCQERPSALCRITRAVSIVYATLAMLPGVSPIRCIIRAWRQLRNPRLSRARPTRHCLDIILVFKHLPGKRRQIPPFQSLARDGEFAPFVFIHLRIPPRG